MFWFSILKCFLNILDVSMLISKQKPYQCGCHIYRHNKMLNKVILPNSHAIIVFIEREGSKSYFLFVNDLDISERSLLVSCQGKNDIWQEVTKIKCLMKIYYNGRIVKMSQIHTTMHQHGWQIWLWVILCWLRDVKFLNLNFYLLISHL